MLVKGSNSISFPMEQEVTTNRSLCFARQGSVEVKTDLGGGKFPPLSRNLIRLKVVLLRRSRKSVVYHECCALSERKIFF